MTAAWILFALGAGCVALVAASARRYRLDVAELGTVSTRWLAEQRAQDHDYPNR